MSNNIFPQFSSSPHHIRGWPSTTLHCNHSHNTQLYPLWERNFWKSDSFIWGSNWRPLKHFDFPLETWCWWTIKDFVVKHSRILSSRLSSRQKAFFNLWRQSYTAKRKAAFLFGKFSSKETLSQSKLISLWQKMSTLESITKATTQTRKHSQQRMT